MKICPLTISCRVIAPVQALPKYTACMSPTVSSLSASAPLTASAVRSFIVRSGCLVNRVMPIPETKTSLINPPAACPRCTSSST